jgi:chloramphenicol O-acetyltransferase type A
MKIINLKTWNRSEHFAFFNSFPDPFFGVTIEVDISKAYQYCKANNIPFHLFNHFQSIRAVNQSEAFRYRVVDGDVVEFDTIHVTTTIGRDDHSFSFAFIPYSSDFKMFTEYSLAEIERVKSATGLGLNAETARKDVIHYSTVPWLSFTSVSHPANPGNGDSVPKITFGKFRRTEGKLLMPVSVHAHHGLMDGYHVGVHLTTFEEMLNEC